MLFFYPKLDNNVIWLGTQYIYLKEHYIQEYVDFYVDVPASLYDILDVDDKNQLYAYVDKYKIAGRKFGIRRINGI